MANEATVTSTLSINQDGIQYRSPQPNRFLADVSVMRGPVPGAFPCSMDGTDLDLSLLTTPGLCCLQNLDATDYVTLGVYDPTSDTFFPVLELLPGEVYVVRLHRFVNRESTGTGTQVDYDSRLQLRANAGEVWVRVDAFEK